MTKNLQYGPCGLFCGACGAEDCAGYEEPPINMLALKRVNSKAIMILVKY